LFDRPVKQSPEHRSWSWLSAAVTTGAVCVHCGGDEDLVAHHKIPRRFGGLDVLENLEPVCRSCHPRVEQDSVAHAKQVWERPEWPDDPRRARRRPGRLKRPY
jgi:5-methylcytosine-specific restriction endonuclease McrA